ATDTTGGPWAPSATITAPTHGALVSGTGAEFFGDGVDDEAPVYAEFYVDGVIEFTDNTAPTGNLGHYHHGGGHLMWDTTLYPDGEHTLTLVVYDASDRTGSHEITVYVANTTPVFQQDTSSSHLVVIEAESAGENTAQGGHAWVNELSLTGFSGTHALRAMPADGALNDTPGYAALSPRLDFLVSFAATGTHYVWVRGWAPSGAGDDDSLHVGLDGVETASADRMSAFGQVWTWSNSTLDAGAVATVDVTTPGLHRVNVWMREAGFAFDKILLTTDATYPAPLGNGPAESSKVGSGTGGPVTAGTRPADAVSNCTCQGPGAPLVWAGAWLVLARVARRRPRC
ncbi:MAG: hypothetical protein HYZ27_05750, partial [Deltaproteobacteria bacterium]|nr:hypothetical protein [Deltaproteobacteria bacterium]